MKKLALCCLAILAAVASTAHAASTTLFYGGDFTTGAPTNYGYSTIYQSNGSPNGDYFRQYQQFSVPGGNLWSVGGLFTNVVTDNIPAAQLTQARYEIRQGVSAGNGGTLLFSGTVSITGTDTGYDSGNHQSGYGNGEIYRFDATLATPFVLNAGTYWMSFTVYSPGYTNLFQAFSNGSNAIDLPTGGGNGYLDGVYNGQHNSVFSTYNYTASEGLVGNAVPEPSSWALLGLGAMGVSVMALRRQRLVA